MCYFLQGSASRIDSFLKIAEEKNIPVLGTKRSTSEFMAELIYCLNEQLAPCITIHGVLVDVYGEGRSDHG